MVAALLAAMAFFTLALVFLETHRPVAAAGWAMVGVVCLGVMSGLALWEIFFVL